jgi:hypothetical protein
MPTVSVGPQHATQNTRRLDMKWVWLVTVLVVLVLVGQGCDIKVVRGSGAVIEEEREVNDFDSVLLTGMGNVYVELGDEETLTIEAEDNLLKHLKSKVKGRTLEIGTDDNVNLHPQEPINFYLTVKELDSVEISGSGDVRLPEWLAGSFSIAISGSGDVRIDSLNANWLDVEISGSGHADISGGQVEKQNIEISGSGDYRARDLECSRAEVRVSGSGEATVWALDELEIDISGSGDVYYVGDPHVEKEVSGSGDIERIGD